MAHVPLSPLGPTFHLSHLTAAPHSRCSWSQTPAPCSWFSVTIFPLGPPAAVEYFYDWFTPSLSIPGCSPGSPQITRQHLAAWLILKLHFRSLCAWHRAFLWTTPGTFYLFAYSSHIWLLSSPCVKFIPEARGSLCGCFRLTEGSEGPVLLSHTLKVR